MDRQLTSFEEQLIRWMLEHGDPGARALLPRPDKAQATPYRCPCGCATINLSIEGFPEPPGELHILADFLFGADDDPSGIFVFEKSGVLAGLEVYGFGGDAPRILPSSDSLKLFSE